MRLIDADALKYKRKWFDCHECGAECDIVYVEWDAIKYAPTIDAKLVVHARWEYQHGDNYPYCSNCAMPQDVPTKYCHECGAKMDGGAD